MHMKMRKWSELFPHGRFIFYEGEDPEGFVREIKTKFQFDPSKDNSWGEIWNYNGKKEKSYAFHCPGHLIDKIYGRRKYPMGS